MTDSLRERKKREMRARLSDTAARMFMERGFDAFRVAEVADACGVSEKTVFNYFPTKEALLLDRLGNTVNELRAGLADLSVTPVEAALRILDKELAGATAALDNHPVPGVWAAAHVRFGDLIRAAPSLRAHQNDMTDLFVAAAAEILADRIGVPSWAPEPQVAAAALLGLWRVQYAALRHHLTEGYPSGADLRRSVGADVRRAAALLTGGLDAFRP